MAPPEPKKKAKRGRNAFQDRDRAFLQRVANKKGWKSKDIAMTSPKNGSLHGKIMSGNGKSAIYS